MNGRSQTLLPNSVVTQAITNLEYQMIVFTAGCEVACSAIKPDSMYLLMLEQLTTVGMVGCRFQCDANPQILSHTCSHLHSPQQERLM